MAESYNVHFDTPEDHQDDKREVAVNLDSADKFQIPALLTMASTKTSIFYKDAETIGNYNTKEWRKRAICTVMSPTLRLREELTAAQLIDLLNKQVYSKEKSSDVLPIWVDVQASDEKDILMIIDSLDLHPTTIDDLICEPVREKWMEYEKYFFLSIHEIVPSARNPQLLDIVGTKAVILPGMMFTFHSQLSMGILDMVGLIRNNDFHVPSEIWYLYLLLRCQIRSYVNRCRLMVFDVESINELILALSSRTWDNRDLMTRTQSAKIQLSILQQYLDIKIGLMGEILESPKNGIQEYLPYFRSVNDIGVRLKYKIQYCQEALQTSVGNFLTLAEIDDAISSQKTNATVNKLTILSTIMLPMGLIASLFGMNVHVPGFGIDTLHWFLGIIIVMLFIGFLLSWKYRTSLISY